MQALREFFAGRRALLGFWILLCVVALLLTARLSVFMFDPAQTSFSLVPNDGFMRRHSCLSAYVAAGDRLGEPGARIYDAASYERTAEDATRRIPLHGLEQDVYEYPPPFLLIPKALLLVSHDFRVLRAIWFVAMTAFLLGAMALTASWIGGRRGLSSALLIPFVWAAFPGLLTIQTGNIQMVIITAALVSMVAFEAGRPAAGGALLAFAVGTKLYPGVLLIVLVAQRRFREVAWTAGFGLLYCGGILAIAGPAPFAEFFSYQLPRLLSGEAFAFFKDDIRAVMVNLTFFGLPYKLEGVGLALDPDRLAPLVSRLYTASLIAITAVIAWKRPTPAPAADPDERAARGLVWLALLNLAVLTSPFAPPYGVLGTIWLLTLWAPAWHGFRRAAVLFAAGWIGLNALIPEPLPATMASGFVMQVVNFSINVAVLLLVAGRRPAPIEATSG